MKKSFRILWSVCLTVVVIFVSISAHAGATATAEVDLLSMGVADGIEQAPATPQYLSSSASSVAITRSWTNTNPNYPGSWASFGASSNGGDSPSVYLSASASVATGGYSGDRMSASGRSMYNWQYMVYDPYGFTSVPIVVSWNAGVFQDINGAARWFGDGHLAVGLANGVSLGGDWNYENWQGGFTTTNLLGSHTLTGYAQTNYLHGASLYLELYVGANDFVWGGGAGPKDGNSNITVSTFIDPTISIDPAWLANHPDDRIYFDTVAAPVPAPPALLLLAPGLFGLAAVRRRFKR